MEVQSVLSAERSVAVAEETVSSLPTPERTDLLRLNAWHLRAVDLHLAGLSNTEIARALDRGANTISLLLKSSLFQDQLARRRAEQNRQIDSALVSQTVGAAKIIEEASTMAAQRIVGLISEGDHKIQLLASKDILDRAGFAPKQAGTQNTVVCNINVDMAQNLMVALKQSRELAEKQRASTLVHVLEDSRNQTFTDSPAKAEGVLAGTGQGVAQ